MRSAERAWWVFRTVYLGLCGAASPVRALVDLRFTAIKEALISRRCSAASKHLSHAVVERVRGEKNIFKLANPWGEGYLRGTPLFATEGRDPFFYKILIFTFCNI